MPKAMHNWRHRFLAKALIVVAVMAALLYVVDQSSRVREIATLWHQREWLFAFIKGIELPPWAQFFLLITCLAASLLAIYELRTRPPIILVQESMYPVGLRSLDLGLGRIDLDITPEELMDRFDFKTGETGLEAAKHKEEFLHKSLFVSGTFLDVYHELGFYNVHLSCGPAPGLVFVRMNTIDAHDHLKKLSKGDRISLRGRITHIGHRNISLGEGEFAGSKRLVSENYSEKPKGPPMVLG